MAGLIVALAAVNLALAVMLLVLLYRLRRELESIRTERRTREV